MRWTLERLGAILEGKSQVGLCGEGEIQTSRSEGVSPDKDVDTRPTSSLAFSLGLTSETETWHLYQPPSHPTAPPQAYWVLCTANSCAGHTEPHTPDSLGILQSMHLG